MAKKTTKAAPAEDGKGPGRGRAPGSRKGQFQDGNEDQHHELRIETVVRDALVDALADGGETLLKAHVKKLLVADSATGVAALNALLKLASNAPESREDKRKASLRELLDQVTSTREKMDPVVRLHSEWDVCIHAGGETADPARLLETVDALMTHPRALYLVCARLLEAGGDLAAIRDKAKTDWITESHAGHEHDGRFDHCLSWPGDGPVVDDYNYERRDYDGEVKRKREKRKIAEQQARTLKRLECRGDDPDTAEA